jgi:hypothetical protein
MSLDLAYINKNAFSWGDAAFFIALPDLGNAGGRLYGFKKFSHGAPKRERVLVYGQNTAQAPIAVSKGKYTPPTPKIEFHAHSLDADATAPYTGLIELLAQGAPDGRSYGETRMNWVFQMLNNGAYAEYRWYNVYIVGESADWEEGPEGLTRECDFICTRHTVNGKTIYDSSQE